MKTYLASQEPTSKIDIPKKVWSTPLLVLIDSNIILAGAHPGGLEINYAPGHIDSSPAFYNFFS